ncbi:hypothetical protein COY32_02000 [candidate division WWE3 bacterium CG_4_10_14_0_2_um_filter_41_14]|uniref:SH3b domain-containing protein n=1 Tax=candidate division WWE3 bacterium CG_4_10_14_0_2_um_filter_41_14 TaxID=1975072 RepID=A0A2M7TKK5_UNCKA|nr:MAG: hypothetical protein COY32_02000 [candidate division WWE3 bacterium CG_4_10_14_0_2_um_filter_41_14]
MTWAAILAVVLILATVGSTMAAGVPSFEGTGTAAYVSVGTTLNVRESQSLAAPQVGKLVCGTQVLVAENAGVVSGGHNFVVIKYNDLAGNEIVGAVSDKYLVAGAPACAFSAAVRTTMTRGAFSETAPASFFTAAPNSFNIFFSAEVSGYVDEVGGMVVVPAGSAPVTFSVWVNPDGDWSDGAWYQRNPVGAGRVLPPQQMVQGYRYNGLVAFPGNNVFWANQFTEIGSVPTAVGCGNAPAGFVTPYNWGTGICVNTLTTEAAIGHPIGEVKFLAGGVASIYIDAAYCRYNGMDADGAVFGSTKVPANTRVNITVVSGQEMSLGGLMGCP